MSEYFAAALQLHEAHNSYVTVTLIASRGSAPQDPGAKALVTVDGLYWGTVGGGKVEARAISHAQTLIAENQRVPQLVTWNLQRDLGMSCGGEVTLLFEVHGHPLWSIAIFGAGHVAQALVRCLLPVQCRLVCFDSREQWLEKLPSLPNLKIQRRPDLREAVAALSPSHFFVVMTQGHATDLPVLQEIFTRFPDAPYIGVIGSRLKGLKLKRELQRNGISESRLEKLHCPMGLDLGTNDPAEIAISIAAELIKTRDQLSSTSTHRQQNAEPGEGGSEHAGPADT